MIWIVYLVAVLVFAAGGASVFLVAVGMPGTWALLALAVVVELSSGAWLPAGEQTFSWTLLGACLVLAIVGEILEAGAGALGAKHGGGSRRGMVLSMIGGIAGAIVGAPFGLLLGSMLGAVVGTFAGALIGELSHPDKEIGEAVRPATAATVGRILGTLSKLPIAIAVWIALTIAAFVR